MYFAYFDESGDSGFTNSPTNTFTLSGILIHQKNWLNTLDQSISFRRFLRDKFHLMPRNELKATSLIHNKADVKAAGINYQARMAAYRSVMRFQRKVGTLQTFAVVVVKDRIQQKATSDPREIAWRYALQRIERFGTAQGENVMIFPDDGHGEFIKKKVRQIRRINFVPSAYGGSTLDRKAINILEDPSDRKSSESFFIQMADLNAYAAFRKVFPGNNFAGDIWDELGAARIADVSKVVGTHTGIVVWPPA